MRVCVIACIVLVVDDRCLHATVHAFCACKKPDATQSPEFRPRRRFSGVAWLAKTPVNLH